MSPDCKCVKFILILIQHTKGKRKQNVYDIYDDLITLRNYC